jgi:hypothetical protein
VYIYQSKSKLPQLESISRYLIVSVCTLFIIDDHNYIVKLLVLLGILVSQ